MHIIPCSEVEFAKQYLSLNHIDQTFTNIYMAFIPKYIVFSNCKTKDMLTTA